MTAVFKGIAVTLLFHPSVQGRATFEFGPGGSVPCKLNLESLHCISLVLPHGEKFPPHIHSESSLFQFMPFVLPPCTAVRSYAPSSPQP